VEESLKAAHKGGWWLRLPLPPELALTAKGARARAASFASVTQALDTVATVLAAIKL
jgi:hypothetical protein